MTDQGPDQPTPENPLPPPPPPPTEPMQVPPASGVGAPGDLGNRFLARLIDTILLSVVNVVILSPLIIASMFAEFSGGFGGFTGFGGFSVAGLVWGILVAAVTIGYFSLMESQIGQTVGKMLLNLRTEGPNGGKPTFEQALKRNAWYALAIIPILGGLAQLAVAIYIAVTINNSATRTGWHDTFAGGTRVVKTK